MPENRRNVLWHVRNGVWAVPSDGCLSMARTRRNVPMLCGKPHVVRNRGPPAGPPRRRVAGARKVAAGRLPAHAARGVGGGGGVGLVHATRAAARIVLRKWKARHASSVAASSVAAACPCGHVQIENIRPMRSLSPTLALPRQHAAMPAHVPYAGGGAVVVVGVLCATMWAGGRLR